MHCLWVVVLLQGFAPHGGGILLAMVMADSDVDQGGVCGSSSKSLCVSRSPMLPLTAVSPNVPLPKAFVGGPWRFIF